MTATVARRSSVDEQRAVRLTPNRIAAMTVVAGLLLVADVVVPRDWRVHSLLTSAFPAIAGAAARAIALVGGWFLLRLARGLRRGRRTEWRLAVVTTLAVLATSGLRVEIRPLELIAVAALLASLLVARDQFTIGGDRRVRRYVLRVLAQGAAITVGFGTTMLLLPDRVPTGVSFASKLGEVAASTVGLGGTIPFTDEYYGDLVHATILVSTLLTLVVAIVAVLRPPGAPPTLDASDEMRLRKLLARHGERDSLGYFALRRDKSIVWSKSGKAAVTFRVLDGVALASGDPLGDPEAWQQAIAVFREMVERNGWVPGVMGSSEHGAAVYMREFGLQALALGDEAILDIDTFSLVGRESRATRHACTRLRRAGYDVIVRRSADVPLDELRDLADAAVQWRGDAIERGFSMALSRFGDLEDRSCVIVTAVRDGRVRGLLHFVPWGASGLSLDLMRRDRAADNGVNEFMIAELAMACPTLGITRVSLNFAVFRDALARGERIGAGPVLRLWRRVLLVASRWYQIESLYRFNDKFSPRWEPRFFCYPRARDVPRLTLAALEAEAFVTRPTWAARLGARRG